MQWLARYERFWSEQLDRLAAFRGGGAMLTKPSLTLKRRLKAPPAQVFAAWTDPEKIVHWFGPARDRRRLGARRDGCARRRPLPDELQDRGRREPPGRRRLPRGGARQPAAVFTWAWHSTPERESLVTVTVATDGDGTHAHAASRAVLRREGARRPQARLDRHARQARALFLLTAAEGVDHGTRLQRRRASAPEASAGARPPPWAHGKFHWNELRTRDVERAKRFYRGHHRLDLRAIADARRPAPTGSPCRTASRSPACSR